MTSRLPDRTSSAQDIYSQSFENLQIGEAYQQQQQDQQIHSQREVLGGDRGKRRSSYMGMPMHSEIQNKKREEKFIKMQQDFLNMKMQEEEREKQEKQKRQRLHLAAIKGNQTQRKPQKQNMNMNHQLKTQMPRTNTYGQSVTPRVQLPKQQNNLVKSPRQRIIINAERMVNIAGDGSQSSRMTLQNHRQQEDDNQRSSQINLVIKKVESIIQQKFQEGNFNVNVNQLETAICEVIVPDNQLTPLFQHPQSEQIISNQQNSVSEENKRSDDGQFSVQSFQTNKHIKQQSSLFSPQFSNVSNLFGPKNNRPVSPENIELQSPQQRLKTKLQVKTFKNLQKESIRDDIESGTRRLINLKAIIPQKTNYQEMESMLLDLINTYKDQDKETFKKQPVSKNLVKSVQELAQVVKPKFKNAYKPLKLEEIEREIKLLTTKKLPYIKQIQQQRAEQEKQQQNQSQSPKRIDQHNESGHHKQRVKAVITNSKVEKIDAHLLEMLTLKSNFEKDQEPNLIRKGFQLTIKERFSGTMTLDKMNSITLTGADLLQSIENETPQQNTVPRRSVPHDYLRNSKIKIKSGITDDSNDSQMSKITPIIKQQTSNKDLDESVTTENKNTFKQVQLNQVVSDQVYLSDRKFRPPIFTKTSSNFGSTQGSSKNILSNLIKTKPFLLKESNTFKQLQNAAMIKRRSNNKEKIIPTLLKKNDLATFEAKFLDQFFSRVKKVQKSLLHSLTGQATVEKMRQGIMIEEAQLADSILYLYWKQKMAKQYYIFSRQEILDRIDIHMDEEKIDEQIQEHKLDLKYFIHSEQTPDKKEQDISLNDALIQLDLPFMVQERQECYLTLEQIEEHFLFAIQSWALNDSYRSVAFQFHPVKAHCSKIILRIANDVYFQWRYLGIVDMMKLQNQFNYIEKKFKKEAVAAKNFGNVKKNNWEVYNPIRDFIFKRPRFSSPEIIKILFQTPQQNIFYLLIDKDDDYELQLTIDTIVNLAIYNKGKLKAKRKSHLMEPKTPKLKTLQMSFLKYKDSIQNHLSPNHLTKRDPSEDSDSSFQNDKSLRLEVMQNEIKSFEEDIFLPLKRKGALRKTYEIRQKVQNLQNGHFRKSSFNMALQTQMLKQLQQRKGSSTSSLSQFKKRKTDGSPLKRNRGQIEYEYSVSSSDESKGSDLDESNYENSFEIEVTPSGRTKSLFFANLKRKKEQVSIKIGQVIESSSLLEMYPRKSTKTVENKLLTQFERECILQLDPSKRYIFEVFVPVEKNKKSNKQNNNDDRSRRSQSEDGLCTDDSMKYQQYDEFGDFDLDIQKQQFKKFLQDQKVKYQKNSVAHQDHNKILKLERDINTLQLKNNAAINRQSLSQFQQYTTIGNYYKNLRKKSKIEDEEFNKAGEVVSGDEFEEDDQDNFYVQMVNNLKIMEMLKEAGVKQRVQSKHDMKKMLKKMKTNHFRLDRDDSKHETSGMGSLFNSSNLKESYSSLDIDSNKSEDSSNNNSSKEQEQEEQKLSVTEDHENVLGQLKFGFKSKQQQVKIKNQKTKRERIQSSDVFKKNLYMVDQNKLEQKIISAATSNNVEELKELMPKFELSIDRYQDLKGNRILSFSAQQGYKEIVKILLNYGANPNLQNKEGSTALHYSINQRFNKITDILLSHGADEKIVNKRGQTPWEGIRK